MAFFLLAMRSGKDLTFKALRSDLASAKMPALYSALAGVSLGLYIDAWSSGYLFEGILLLAIIIQAMVDYVKDRDVEYLGVSGAITFLLAMVMVLPFVKLYNGFTNYLYSLFQPTILLAGIAACVLIGFLAQVLRQKGLNKFYFPGAIVGASALGILVMSIIMPQFTDAFYHGLSIFQPRAGGAATVAEVSPLVLSPGDLLPGHHPGLLPRAHVRENLHSLALTLLPGHTGHGPHAHALCQEPEAPLHGHDGLVGHHPFPDPGGEQVLLLLRG